MKIKDLIKESRGKLQNFSLSPDLDIEILLSFVLRTSRESILSNPKKEITDSKTKAFKKLLKRRTNQEPIAHIIELKNFYGRDFKVNKNTLIPRPETEGLIEKVLEYSHKEIYPSKKSLFIDLGTGSGCILLTLVKELFKAHNFSAASNNFKFIGSDISSKALEIARKNHQKIAPEIEIDFWESDLLDFLDKRYLKYLDNTQIVITANLPYLSQKVYENCPKSVSQFEPKIALLAKKEGLDLYLKLLEQIKEKHLRKKAWGIYLIFEISPEQKEKAEKLFKELVPEAKLKFSKDLAGKWRFIEIQF